MASSNQCGGINCEDSDSGISTTSRRSLEQPPSIENCVSTEALVIKIKFYIIQFDSDVPHLQALIDKLTEITDSLETTHRNTTIGSITGGVIGAAGGITSIVGLVLAPFTLGLSLAVTGIGVGVAVAGGVTGATSNIIDMVQQKTSREEIEVTLKAIQNKFTPLIERLQDIENNLQEIQISELAGTSTRNIQIGSGLVRGVGYSAEVVRVVKAVRLGKQMAKLSKTVRAAGALTGVLSGLFLALDIVFIVSDVQELNEIDKCKKDGRVKSETVKFIQDMRKTEVGLRKALAEMRKVKNQFEIKIIQKIERIVIHRDSPASF